MKPGDAVFVTQYALTLGIVKTHVYAVTEDGALVTVWWDRGWMSGKTAVRSRYVALTEEDAFGMAWDMALKRCAALRRQLKKLEAFTPKVVEMKEGEE